MTITDRIEINPKVMLGKPVIRGTRIPVEVILRKLADGATQAQLLDAYPRLAREDIRAAIAYAADALEGEGHRLYRTGAETEATMPPQEEFWRQTTLDELAREQGVQPVAKLDSLLGEGADLWETDEKFDAFVAAIYERRREGLDGQRRSA